MPLQQKPEVTVFWIIVGLYACFMVCYIIFLVIKSSLIDEPRERKKQLKAEEEDRAYWEKRDKSWVNWMHESKIVDSWTAMVEEGKGMGGEFLKKVEERVNDARLENAKFSRRMIYIGSRWQEFLVIHARPLKVFDLFIGTEDSGGRLEVTWYLALMGGTRAPRSLEDIDPAKTWVKEAFDPSERHQMRNCLKIVNGIILDEIKKMMGGLNLDFSKNDVHTRGFLNL